MGYSKKLLSAILLLGVFFQSLSLPSYGAPSEEDFSNLKLTFSTPGAGAYQGLPLGNGRIGVRIHGGVEQDLYRLNDATFWGGGPQTDAVYDVTGNRKKALEQTRTLLEGDLHNWDTIKEIETSAKKMASNSTIGSYLPLGDMILSFPETGDYKNYSRTLDLDTATATVRYTIDGVDYTRESFTSFPDNVLVTRLTASKQGQIDVTAALKYRDEMEGHDASVGTNGQDELIMRVRAPYLSQAGQSVSIWKEDEGMWGEAHVKILNQGGTKTAGTDSISIQNADEVLLIYSSATSYNGPDKNPYSEGKDPTPIIEKTLRSAVSKTYKELYETHLQDYQAIFRKLQLEINSDPNNANVLAFQMKRYDLISTSRYGDRPRSAFGIWNEDFNPTSEGSHYLNENIEKMYGHMEPANISEVGEPLWNWMDELKDHGSVTAEKDFGFRGWTVGHNSDIWATTTLRPGRTEWSIFPVGGIWITNIAWEHYLFTQDEDFLRERAYPLLKGAAEFASDLLVERQFTENEVTCPPGTYLVTSPSTSCENSYGMNYGQDFIQGLWPAVSVGSTQDMAMVRGIFESCIKACEILDIDPALKAELEEKYSRLLPYQIHKTGEIQEWAFEDYMGNWDRDLYKNHRHASHLIGVWPYGQITQQTPVLQAAAKKALDTRGDGTASRMPDKAAMLARLGYGDEALKILPTGTKNLVGDKWCDNLQNAVCEMLLQSHADGIDLLPALPSQWKSGKINGICARGGYELNIEWENSELTRCIITSKTGDLHPVIRYQGELLDPQSDPRILVIDGSTEQKEADDFTASITPLERSGNLVSFQYEVQSNQDQTATNVDAVLDVYEQTPQGPVKVDSASKSNKLYNLLPTTGTVKYDASALVGDQKTYLFTANLYRRSDKKPLTQEEFLEHIIFEPEQLYDSATGFTNQQGPVWYYQYTQDQISFHSMENYVEEDAAVGSFWRGTQNYLRCGSIFMHPVNGVDTVRTFTAPTAGKVSIHKATIKAQDNKGTSNGIQIKIVKSNSDGSSTQLYPPKAGWKLIENAEHMAGAVIPALETTLLRGEQIHFILNSNGSEAHDGSLWQNQIEYLKEEPTPPTPGITLSENSLVKNNTQLTGNISFTIVPQKTYREALIVLAVFEDNTLNSVITAYKDLFSSENNVSFNDLNVTGLDGICTLKAFAWTKDLEPLSPVWSTSLS